MKSQQLDLPPILISNGKKMIKPNGNPRYLVSIYIVCLYYYDMMMIVMLLGEYISIRT